MTARATFAVVRRMAFTAAMCLIGICVACTDKTEVAGAAAEVRPTDEQWTTYNGGWFTIEYPSSFDVVPSLESDESGVFDSVFFRSQDGRASFYVISPQWGRAAVDIALAPELETELHRHERSESDQRRVEKAIRANDGSYTREVEEFFEQDGTVYWAFEFRYADEPTRQQYEAGYQRFKMSLDQYSD